MNAAQDVDFIVVSEVVYAAGLVAEKLGIKWAFCTLNPSSFFSIYDPPVIPVLPILAKLRVFGPLINQGVRASATWVSNSWFEPYYKFREELGYGRQILTLSCIVSNFSCSSCTTTRLAKKYSYYRIYLL